MDLQIQAHYIFSEGGIFRPGTIEESLFYHQYIFINIEHLRTLAVQIRKIRIDCLCFIRRGLVMFLKVQGYIKKHDYDFYR